ncbi:MAG TPA: PKD domain-containing protein, partial [Thermoplasmatales archaeon]|nr:PKD domain-containing protein [Thermoplasmatales archaeon]
YAWDFGDGHTGYGRHCNHSFSDDGTYLVNLTVTDDDGAHNATVRQVTVKNAHTLSTATYPQDGGEISLDPPGGVYAEDTVVAATATPASGYVFSHWSGDGSGSDASLTITMDGDKSITAHFSEILPPHYTLSASVWPSGSGTVTLDPTGGTYNQGDTVSLTAVPATGYRFDHWSGDLSGSGASQTLAMDENKTVTAYFQPLVQYTLSTEVSPPGAGRVSPPGGTYNQGDTVTLTALANAGYTFAYWSGDASGTSRSIQVTMDRDRQMVAHFQEAQLPPPPPQYSLSISVQPSTAGAITLSPPGGTYDQGTTVTATASAGQGYVFSHWSGDTGGNASTVQISMTSEKSVTAHFSPVTQTNTPPTVSIAGPENNATLSGLITMNGSAQDSDGSILRVEVRIDGGAWTTAQGTDSWQYAWDTASLANGEHILAARSFDGTDYSPVATRTVYVDNPGNEGGASLPLTLIIAVVAVAGIAGGALAFYLKRRP